MSNTPGATESEAAVESAGVLRPFVEEEHEPLPPVEAPTLSGSAADDEPASADLDGLDDVDATDDDAETPEDEPPTDADPLELVIADLDTLPTRPRDEILAEARWTMPDDLVEEAPEPAELEDIEAPDADAGTADEEMAAPVAVPAAAPDETVTLPRKAFLLGLGAVAAVIALLVILWQTAGGDGDTTTADADAAVEGDAAGADGSAADAEPTPATAPPEIDDRSDEVDELTDKVAELEGQLADQPAPSLPGAALERIVVASDTKFVSAIPGSVAVVSPFGDVGLIDPANNRLVGAGNIAASATRVLRTPSAAWVTNFQGNEILRVDPASFAVISRFEFPGPDGLLAVDGTLVVASYAGGFVARIEPGGGTILQQVEVGGNPTAVALDAEGRIWAAVYDSGELVQIDPVSFEVLERVGVGAGPVGLTVSDAGIWVANHEGDSVVLVDVETGEVVEEVVVGDGPTELVEGCGSLWVTVTDTGDLVEIDTADSSVVTRTPLGGTGVNGGPTGIAHSDDDLWIAMLGERSVVRVRCAEVG